MKMRSKDAPTKDQQVRLNKAVYQDCLDAMSTNLAMYCAILHDEFGFGEKRIRLFLNHTLEYVKWFGDFDDDDIAMEQLKRRFETTGIKFSEIFGREDMYEYAHKQKVQKKHAVSVKEAAEIKKKLDQIKILYGGK